MIKEVIEQDVEEFLEHLKRLQDKYDQDFFFVGAFGIVGDEEGDKTPVNNSTYVYGQGQHLHSALHHLLDTEAGAMIVTDAFNCHCRNLLPKHEPLTELRDKILKVTQKEMVERAREQEAGNDVSRYLKTLGMY